MSLNLTDGIMHRKNAPHLPDLDTRKLSDFIYELNIARRHLSTYPAGHPLIHTVTTRVLTMLEDLLEFRAELVLGVARDALMFEGEWLDRKNPVYRDFAQFLFGQGIATIHFLRHIRTGELLRVNQLLRASRAEIFQQGGYAALLEAQRIEHIKIVPIDYRNFTRVETESPDKTEAAAPERLWEDFLRGLMEGVIDPAGSEQHMPPRFDPQLVAEIFNRKAKNRDADGTINYEAVITAFIGQHQNTRGRAEDLGQMIKALNPEVRRQFLNSTFRNLADTPQAETVLQAFPQDVLVNSLREATTNTLEIPTTILNLLAKLKQHQHMGRAGTRIAGESQLDTDEIQERMHLIFREEDNGKFIPEAYQNALHTIVASEQLSLSDPEEIRRLRHELDSRSVERQTGFIAFEILRAGAKPELKQTLERNLIDLARFFLETADFNALEDLYQRWHNILAESASNTTILNEELLASLHGDEFIDGTLAAIDVYGKEKQDEIRQYILAIGEPFAQKLIQRLALSESQSQRRFYLACLEQMGSHAHAEMFKALDDERWFLVRNLIGVLAKSRNPAVLKRLFPLLEHPHPQVRQRVLKLMLNFNRPRAERQLLVELQSTSTSELLFAVRIAHLGQDKAIQQQLLRLLQHPSFKADVFELKVEILKTLARRGDAEVVSTLEALLKAGDLRHPLQYRRFKLEIVKTLGQYPAARVRPLLEQLMKRGGKEIAALATEQLRSLIRSQS